MAGVGLLGALVSTVLVAVAAPAGALGGQIGFVDTSTSVPVTEAAVTVDLAVVRTGGDETASVTWAVTGTATGGGDDYAGAADGTLTWTGSENTTQNISFTIVDDDVGEDPETIVVTLSPGTASPDVTPAVATITITDAPVANDDDYETLEDVVLIADPDLLANDSAGLEVISTGPFTEPTLGDLSPVAVDGSFTFTPAPDESGTGTFSYTVSDGTNTDTATVTITVDPDNDPPVANPDTYVVDEDMQLFVPIEDGPRANDTDVDNPTSDLEIVFPASGKTEQGGDLTQSLSAGRFTYTPPPDFFGTDTFTYTLRDPDSATDTGLVSIDVGEVNDDPIAPNLNLWPVKTVPTDIDLSGQVTDPDGDPLAIQVLDGPELSGATFGCNGLVCTYNPPDGVVDIDRIEYSVTDGTSDDTGVLRLFIGFPRTGDFSGQQCQIDLRLGQGPNGTAGNDVICGTDGADVIDGGGGNDLIVGLGGDDVLIGGPGDDILSGGAGDDSLVPGAGDDESIGGPGTDDVTYVGTSGDDTMVLTGDSSTSPAGEDSHVLVETVIADLAAGVDTVSVSPSVDITFVLAGGPGFDRLVYNSGELDGVLRSGNSITAPGRRPVQFSGFESIDIGSFFVPGTAGDDVRRFVSSFAVGLQIDMLGGSDHLTIDFGRLEGPVQITDSGLDGIDTLTLRGTTGRDDIELTPSTATRGTERVEFADQEHVIVDGLGGDDIITLDLRTAATPAAVVPRISIDGGGGNDRLVVLVPAGTCATVVGDVLMVPGIAPIALDGITAVDLACGPRGARTVSLIDGYWVASADGSVSSFGEVADLGGVPSGSPVGAIAKHPDKTGYWVVRQDGSVTAFGSAADHGSVQDRLPAGLRLAAPIVSMTSTASGDGYYLLGRDGGVFTFGDGVFHGSTGGLPLVAPVVAMAANPTGGGYWFVASDGGIFTYGPGTSFHGSVPGALPPGSTLAAPIVGMAPTATGQGYWLVAADGGVFTFGDAQFLGAIPGVLGPLGLTLDSPIVGMVATSSGHGYWLVAADGGVFTFGDADFYGSEGGRGRTDVVGLAG